MTTFSRLSLRRTLALALLTALLAMTGLVATAVPAQAADHTLTATGCGATTTAKACRITVKYAKGKAKVKKATAQLQYFDGTRWVNEKKGRFKIRKGKGSVSIRNKVTDRTYRVKVGATTSQPFTVAFLPATFTFRGSGEGHGVGLAQYGAYQLAREGRTAAEILQYYYPGVRVDAAVNRSARNIRVQVFGQPGDHRTRTTLAITTGGFTIRDAAGNILATTRAKKPVKLGVKGGKATAKVTPANGKARTVTAARLVVSWPANATVTVAGAHGSYRSGTLQATVIKGRLNVSNELAMNTDYLYGIDEMPASWGADGVEALKAQAIAARSYVIGKASAANVRFGDGQPDPSCDCQILDDPQHQNFTGWKKAGESDPRWRQAVDQTMSADGGYVTAVRPPLGVPGSFAETPYYASSAAGDGIGTGANTDVWAGVEPIPYLPSVADPYSAAAPRNPYLSWAVDVPVATLQTLLKVNQPIRQVTVTETHPGGLVRTLTVVLANGEARSLTLPANGWKAGLGLNSPWLTSISGR